MPSSLRRPYGRLSYFLISLLLAALPARAQAPATTTVQDVVYRANGQPAAGSIVISWPAFSTANGKAVAAGTLTLQLQAGGSLSAALVPNEGATPAGTYYKIVYKLDDGTTSTEYWSVPVLSPITIAAIRTELAPRSPVALGVTKQYVDALVAASNAAAVHIIGTETIEGAKEFLVPPKVPAPSANDDATNKEYVNAAINEAGGQYIRRLGDTMDGPLVLAGMPATNEQAAPKAYVDDQLNGFKANGVFTGTVTTPQLRANSIGNSKVAAEFPGADWCAKVAAASAALGAAAGEILLDQLAGTSACAGNLTLANDHALVITQGGTYAAGNVDIRLGQRAAIIGKGIGQTVISSTKTSGSFVRSSTVPTQNISGQIRGVTLQGPGASAGTAIGLDLQATRLWGIDAKIAGFGTGVSVTCSSAANATHNKFDNLELDSNTTNLVGDCDNATYIAGYHHFKNLSLDNEVDGIWLKKTGANGAAYWVFDNIRSQGGSGTLLRFDSGGNQVSSYIAESGACNTALSLPAGTNYIRVRSGLPCTTPIYNPTNGNAVVLNSYELRRADLANFSSYADNDLEFRLSAAYNSSNRNASITFWNQAGKTWSAVASTGGGSTPAFGMGLRNGAAVWRFFALNSANGYTRINAEGIAAVSINKDANSGTGGFEVCDGAASPLCLFTVSSAGIVNAAGYKVGGAATSGNYLRCNGTACLLSALQSADLPAPAVGAKGGVEARTCSGSDRLSAIGTDGVPVCSATTGGSGGAVYTLHFVNTSVTNPADSTTYFAGYGANSSWVSGTYNAAFSREVPVTGTITRVDYMFRCSVTTGSAESVTVDLWLNNATSAFSTSQSWNTTNPVKTTATGSLAVTAGDDLTLRIQAPAWATNPTNCTTDTAVYITAG